jgi:hypothetical protein
MLDLGAHHCEVYNNQVVDTVNTGIGIASGHDNSVHDNRVLFDGRDDEGNMFTAANVGVYVWNLHDVPEWANNQAFDNQVGWVRASGRNDTWLPDCSGNCSNTSVAGTVNRALEQAEYQAWHAKVAAKGITIGY